MLVAFIPEICLSLSNAYSSPPKCDKQLPLKTTRPTPSRTIQCSCSPGSGGSLPGAWVPDYLFKGKLKAQDKKRYGGRCRPCTMGRVPDANTHSSFSNSSQTVSHSYYHPLAQIRVSVTEWVVSFLDSVCICTSPSLSVAAHIPTLKAAV